MSSNTVFKIPRVHTPTLLQMVQVECGAVALSIVLRFYGLKIPLGEIRKACAISRDGVSIVGMIRAAISYGLNAEPLYLEIEDLKYHKMPLVLHWTFGHYVVLEGVVNDFFYINDPSIGRTKVSYREFDESFTGIALSLLPSEHFQKGNSTPSFFRLASKHLRGTYKSLSFLFIVGLTVTITTVAQPILLKIFVDEIIVRGIESWQTPLLVGIIGTLGISATLIWFEKFLVVKLRLKLSVSMSAHFFFQLLQLSASFIGSRAGGELIYQLNLNDSISKTLLTAPVRFVIDISIIILLICLMLSYNIFLSIVCIFFALINVLALSWSSKRREDEGITSRTLEGKLYGVGSNGLSNIDALHATSSTSAFFNIWSGHHARVFNAEQRLGVLIYRLSVLAPHLSKLTSVSLLILGGSQAMQGEITLGMLIAFSMISVQINQPLESLLWIARNLYRTRADIDRIEDTMREDTTDDLITSTNDKNANLTRLSGHIEMHNITFGYNYEERPLINNFNLRVFPGQRVALVGPTGSGKSTIANLLAGVFEPWGGEILFDGISRKSITKTVLTDSIGLVDQEIFLFEGSVQKNLTMWNTQIQSNILDTAIRDAHIKNEIQNRIGGIESDVVEGGSNFSGGERQRLELARIMASGANILILDEAMSALDPEVELAIDDNIRRRGCTCIIVAHRLSTIRDCDEILVLEKGGIIARGNHDELMKSSETYRNLVYYG